LNEIGTVAVFLSTIGNYFKFRTQFAFLSVAAQGLLKALSTTGIVARFSALPCSQPDPSPLIGRRVLP
jgi:hypothetical protein